MSDELLDPLGQNYGPGNVLRSKREEYEWSVEAVAQALHLSSSAIRAIEADRYDELPGATYVMGYWRSYARLLNIDMEDTIDANKRNLNIIVPEPSGIDVNRIYYKKSYGRFWGWCLLLAGIGALSYYGWQQQFFGSLGDLTQRSQTTVRPTGDADDTSGISADKAKVLRPVVRIEKGKTKEIAALKPSVLSNLTPMNTQVGRPLKMAPKAPITQGQPGLVMQGSKASTTASKNTPALADVISPNSGANKIELNTEVVSDQSKNDLQPNLAGTLATEEKQIDATGSAMVFRLSKNSWLDVRDKTNQRLIYRTANVGERVVVKGNPPFYIYIGTPSGVKLSYKGKDVPFETHQSGLFARFKLGETLESL